MILKYLEFYRELYYTNFKIMTESEIWLASLTVNNFVELNEVLSHILENKDKNLLIKEVVRMSKLNFSLHECERKDGGVNEDVIDEIRQRRRG